MPEEQLASTAERTLRLIELLLAQPEGLTPQELQVQLDLSRSSLFLLLRTLKVLGYVEQAEKRGRYRPGPRLMAWRSTPGSATQDMITAFYQESTTHPWEETLALVTPSSEGLLVLAQTEGTRQVRSVFTAGQIYPDLMAAAHVLYSLPPASVQANGYSLLPGGDSLNLALPVCPDGHRAEAALMLSAPAFRWNPPEKLTAAVLDDLRMMAARLSYRLGATDYAPYRSRSDVGLSPTVPMNEEEIALFLQGPWAARLACIRPDGLPHVIPVWQEWDGHGFVVIAWEGSQWAEYLLQNPNVSLTVDEPWPPLRRVVARGRAETAALSPAAQERLVARLSRRYLGQGAGARAGRVQRAFHILPDYLRGWQGMPGLTEG